MALPATSGKAKRPKSAVDTKARILAAAEKCFVECSYSSVGVRDIAAAAGVSNALIARYFGSKAELFEAALISTIDLKALLQSDEQSLVETLLRGVMTQDLGGTAMALRSTGDLEVRSIIEKVTNDHIIPLMVDIIGPPYAEERVLNILILISGYLLSIRVLPVGRGDNEFTREWLSHCLQQIVAGPDAPAVPPRSSTE